MSPNAWFNIPHPKQNARLRLFCFPYAGGNCNTYLKWAADLAEDIELVAVQPPGRAARINESPISSMPEMIRQLRHFDAVFQAKPFALFGHSLGSKIAYELAATLIRQHIAKPIHLFISGSGAPHVPCNHEPLHSLPEAQFIEKLEKLNGTPSEILRNRELMALLTPLIRADFKIGDTYQAVTSPIHCAFTVFGGDADYDVTREMLHAWHDLSLYRGPVHMVGGDHFFIEQNPLPVINVINHTLSPSKNIYSGLVDTTS